MKLEKINVQNYRSILNQEIDFVENCIGLIGLNESGKSNVLNSIRSIDTNFALTYKDKSKISGKFPTIEYRFSIEPKELEFLNEKLKGLLNSEIVSTKGLRFELIEVQNILKTVKIDRVNDSINRVFSFEFDFNYVFNGIFKNNIFFFFFFKRGEGRFFSIRIFFDFGRSEIRQKRLL